MSRMIIALILLLGLSACQGERLKQSSSLGMAAKMQPWRI
jgi:hypothetical protein